MQRNVIDRIILGAVALLAALPFGQVFYFPNGVERPYGSEELGSQYQGKQTTEFSK